MKILIFGDTHSFLDPELKTWINKADECWHTGDIGSQELVNTMAKNSKIKAVHGNIDDMSTRKIFPEELLFKAEELSIYITHIGGYPPKYAKGIKSKLLSVHPDIFICGHSHILKIMRDQQMGNLLYINPGAMGKEGFHHRRTSVWLEISKNNIIALEVIDFGPRAAIVST